MKPPSLNLAKRFSRRVTEELKVTPSLRWARFRGSSDTGAGGKRDDTDGIEEEEAKEAENSDKKDGVPSLNLGGNPDAEERAWLELERLVEENQAAIDAANVGINSEDKSAADKAISSFEQNATIVIQVLEVFGEIHPAIKASVTAFQLVVNLDKSMTDNNDKIQVLRVQITRMMIAFADFRRFREQDRARYDAMDLRTPIGELAQQFEQDITEFASFSELYTQKRPIKQAITKTASFNSMLHSHVTEMLSCSYWRLARFNKQDLFPIKSAKFNTPQEKIIYESIQRNGGSRRILDNQEALENLLTEVKFPKEEIHSLKAELFEDVTKLMHDHLSSIQHTISALLSAGAHDSVEDPRWPASVGSQNLVKGLHQHFSGQLNLVRETPRSADQEFSELKYVSGLTNARRIMEVIDSDGTGDVTLQEANTFAARRPKGWSLLQWIAFWGRGWEINAAHYRDKILEMFGVMDGLYGAVPDENTYYVGGYLESPPLIELRSMLPFIQARGEGVEANAKITTLSKEYLAIEKETFYKNMEAAGYDLWDGVDIVSQITEGVEIEKSFLPLMFILLSRHLNAIQYACTNHVDSFEFPLMVLSLEQVFGDLSRRLSFLRDQPEGRGLQSIACGMVS
ncbi:hypothetical protein D9756_003618 [Leucocoprinus leucothites]|uniref:EF-hand domain-containing protein n=1 Tax=Leucocoprinus leucothites TaxID=201217 RepID=A0A8H5LJG8_9AGAR|nr:hypothetical protein D9756_003618 [Leucoagaricus leucothites]